MDPAFSFTTAWDMDAAARGAGGAGAGGWLAGAAVGAGVSGCSSGTEGVTSIGSENGIPGKREKSVTDIEELSNSVIHFALDRSSLPTLFPYSVTPDLPIAAG